MIKKQHKLHIDALRLLAIFFVILNHTPAYGMPFKDMSADMDCVTFLGQLFSCFNKAFAVPCFLMISGALLLGKDEPIATTLSRRVWKFVQALLLFMIIQYSYYCCVTGGDAATLRNFIADIYRCDLGKSEVLKTCKAGTVWYFGIHLGLLLCLPLLRPMAVNMKNSAFIYVAGLILVCTIIIPELAAAYFSARNYGFAVNLRFPLQNIYIFCVLMGYYLEHRVNVENITIKQWKMLGVGVIVSQLIAVVLLRGGLPTLGNVWCMLISTAVLYLFVKKLFTRVRVSEKVATVMRTLGASVFTVMMIEGVIRATLIRAFAWPLELYWMSFVLAATVLVIGLVIGLVAKRIPYIKNIV